jgi:hypothetical protein
MGLEPKLTPHVREQPEELGDGSALAESVAERFTPGQFSNLRDVDGRKP